MYYYVQHNINISFNCQHMYVIMYHISLFSENTIIQTLWTHPLHRQFHHSILPSLAVIVSGIDVLSQAKVRDLYHIMKVNPAQRQYIIDQ